MALKKLLAKRQADDLMFAQVVQNTIIIVHISNINMMQIGTKSGRL